MNRAEFLKLTENFDTIIFDYGGIFIDIDYELTVKAFGELSKSKDVSSFYNKAKQVKFFSDFETGDISSNEFLSLLRKELALEASDDAVIAAWNAMLIRIRQERVDFLEDFSKTKRVFLLSNINQIHEDFLDDYIAANPKMEGLYGYFEKVYFSHKVGLRKPHREIFDLVIQENSLEKDRTLFIDDSSQHVEGAISAGLHAHLLNPPNSLIVGPQ